MADECAPSAPTSLDAHRRRAEPQLFTVKQVGDACGLPGPVIMQLVPRTWTTAGWMYTTEQLHEAIAIAENLRRERTERDAR